ncbi:hypothetical protein ACA910_019353 [Epithemia clementina (nom. ined.)]
MFSSSASHVALSSDGRTLAFLPINLASRSVTSILRVLIFQVASGSLQTTLTHRYRAEEQMTGSLLNPIKVLFVGSNLLAVLYDEHLLTWDLKRGVVAHTIGAKSDVAFCDACSGEADNQDLSVYILVSYRDTGRTQIHKFDAVTGTLKRKVKVAKGKAACGLGVTQDFLVVRHEDSLRVLSNSATANKLHIYDSLTEANHMNNHNLVVSKTTAATLSHEQIVLIDLKSGGEISSVALDKTTSANMSFNLWHNNASDLALVEGEKVYKISRDDGHILRSWSCPFDNSLDLQVRVGHGDSVVAFLSKNGKYQVTLERLDETKDELELKWTLGNDSAAKQLTEKEKLKRKHAPPQETVVGPDEAGGDALLLEGPSSKKSRLAAALDDEDDDDDDGGGGGNQALCERLQMLQQALDEEADENDDDDDNDENMVTGKDTEVLGFHPRQATTESLGKMLDQALQSGDDKMLELALAVRDQTILLETCKELSNEHLLKLLNALTSRLAAKGSRAEHLCVWISVLLKSGRIRSIAHLQPLRNLIQERIEVFPDLLKLQGRLSLLSETHK